MSYILEALEKSAKERQRHSGLSRPSVQQERITPLSRRPFWFALLAIALLINAGLLGWWIKPWQAKVPEAVRPGSANEEIETLNPGARDNRSRQPIVGLAQPYDLTSRPAVGGEKSTSPSPTVQNTDKVTPRCPPSSADQREKGRPPVPARPDLTAEHPLSPSPAEKEKSLDPPNEALTSEPVDTTEEGPDEGPSSPPSVSAERPTSADTLWRSSANTPTPAVLSSPPAVGLPAATVPDIDKLPASVRDKLPAMTISFHFYARDPGSRMVSINGLLLREGQSVNDDLKVEEIVADGVIMSYQGERFRKGIFAPGVK